MLEQIFFFFGSASAGTSEVKLWMAIPFALLLVLIAVMPLTPHKIKHLWEKFYPHVAIFLGVAVAIFYSVSIESGHVAVWHSLKEYISFIALVGSLFVISGGIVIHFKGDASPQTNVIFLFVGALLANLIGTTGASMVLIRPWLRMNKERISALHVVFFIFIVSNIGGALTPIGDPPLYIGYLRGVPFFWILENALLPWAFVVAALLAIFWFFDTRRYAKFLAEKGGIPVKRFRGERAIDFRGIKNVGYLFVVVAAVFLPGQFSAGTREILETFFVREIVMIGAAFASFFTTNPNIHHENKFSFEPIKEVGFLFIGIFLTMVPALAYLSANAKEIGETLSQASHYFFASGALSGFLDNTPTYANFFDLIKSQIDAPDDAARVSQMVSDGKEHALRVAISLGSVFFGALTYIGNGPNFMVKSIADASGVKMPTFFGYVGRFSLPILIPILILCAAFFLPNFSDENAAGTTKSAGTTKRAGTPNSAEAPAE